MHKEIEEDFEDHYPANGLIEFMFGENQNFRSDNLKFKPVVGKMLVFPSWLKHFVYPFKSKGERRSMSVDDIIGILCATISEEIMIISGDKDFIQLQKYPNVKQYSPITKKNVNGENPGEYLKEHIFKGDTSDGVPNVLSPDNTFTDGLRQKPLGKNKIASWMEHDFDDVAPNDEVKRNYQRNRKLIDLTYTPEELTKEIINSYNEAPFGDRSKLLNYFIQKRLKNLTESIGEF